MRAEVLAKDNQQWLRTSGAEGPRFEEVPPAGIVFSAERSTLGYAAQRTGRWWVVLGPKESGPWDGVAEPCFSPDGSRFAFAAQTALGWQAVVDGRIEMPFEAIQARTLQFSRDGRHVAYVGSTGACNFIVVDGQPSPCHQRVLSLRVTNPGSVAAVVREGSQERFLFGSEAGAPVDAVGDWTATDDGRHVAYAARAGGRWRAVVDGIPSADCARVQHVRFGDAGRRVGWVCGERGQASVVIDGIPGAAFLFVSPPLLAAQAPDYAYVAHDERGAWVVTADATQGPFAEVRDLSLASRGGIPVFLARQAGVARVMHGLRQTPLSAAIEGSLVLSEDGRHWAVIDGDPVGRTLWLLIDGKRVRRIASDEVFGETVDEFTPWLARELRELSKAAPQGENGS
jgi:hypothetical protein